MEARETGDYHIMFIFTSGGHAGAENGELSVLSLFLVGVGAQVALLGWGIRKLDF
jgi:hypothetical protein